MGSLAMSEQSGAADHPRMWEDTSVVERLRAEFPELEVGVEQFRDEITLVVPSTALTEVLAFLRDDPDCAFDFLTDVTAVHWPARPEPFDVVFLLYSFPRNLRLRVKTHAGPEPRVPSATDLWPGANWLERECYDMFGVVFDGHPDLRRILMPDDFEGWPLRKEFPLKC